ncbi:MAG: ABC transporter permease [Armatimonadota bacterium]
MSQVRTIFLIAGNTITGVLRGVVLNVLLVLAALLIVGATATTSSSYQEGEMRRLLVDSGLAVITVLGAMITILTGFTMIPKEVESRTIYPVLAKPTSRWQFVIGKFLGATGISGLTVGMLSILFFGVYYFKLHEFDPRLLMAVVMIFAMLTVLSALIIFFSTFMSWIGTIIASLVIWFGGSYSQYLNDMANYHTQGAAGIITQAIQKLLPNFQAMDMRYAIVTQELQKIDTALIMDYLRPLGNGGLYLVIALVLAILIFNYREL